MTNRLTVRGRTDQAILDVDLAVRVSGEGEPAGIARGAGERRALFDLDRADAGDELGVAKPIGPVGEDGSARIAERGMTEHVDHPDGRIRRERDRRVLGDLERDQPRQRAVDGSLP